MKLVERATLTPVRPAFGTIVAVGQGGADD